MLIYDLAIIGGGPAGLTAGIYASRALIKTVMLERLMPGGLVVTTEKVENYPGFESISGAELAKKIRNHAESYKLVTIKEELATDIEKKETPASPATAFASKVLPVPGGP